MPYTLIDFAKSLYVDKLRITNTPKLIFVCGGEIAKSGKAASARDIFWRRVRKDHPDVFSRLRQAEEINRWFERQPLFNDLLELEKWVAWLTDLIVLFVESAGAIAELGAFSMSDELRAKTLAILTSREPTEGTFIADGPVLRIKNANPKRVLYYPWDLKKPGSKSSVDQIADATLEILRAIETDRPRAEAFSGKPHQWLLVLADLVAIAGAASEDELKESLGILGYQEASEHDIERMLYLLGKLKLIKRRYRASQTFFTRTAVVYYGEYAFRPDTVRDMARIKSDIRESLDRAHAWVLQEELENPTTGAGL